MVDYVLERHLSGGIRWQRTRRPTPPDPPRLRAAALVLAMHQHRGTPAEPVVAVGERVLKGEMIGRAAARALGRRARLDSGWVRAIEERPALGGNGVQSSLCIVIETDGRDESVAATDSRDWPSDRAAQREAIRAGGIVGLGGAVFPTADKLAAPMPARR